MGLEFRIVSNDISSPHFNQLGQHYLKDYYKLRNKVFSNYGMNYYDDEAEYHDLHEDTMFILILDDKKVVGGRRIAIHKPFSSLEMKTEATIEMPIRYQLRHLYIHEMLYAEIGGLCFDPTIQGKGLSEKMYKETFDLIKLLGCKFVVTEIVPNNLKRIMQAAHINGAVQVVPRTEHLSIDGFADFRLYITFDNDIDLLSDSMRAMGIGRMLSDQEIDELIDLRSILIESRK